jgi:hypothetical protein
LYLLGCNERLSGSCLRELPSKIADERRGKQHETTRKKMIVTAGPLLYFFGFSLLINCLLRWKCCNALKAMGHVDFCLHTKKRPSKHERRTVIKWMIQQPVPLRTLDAVYCIYFWGLKELDFFQIKQKGGDDILFVLVQPGNSLEKKRWNLQTVEMKTKMNGNPFFLWKNISEMSRKELVKNKRNGKNSFFYSISCIIRIIPSCYSFCSSSSLLNVKETSSRTSKLTNLIKHCLFVFLQKTEKLK